jgi:hypothetical protein
MKTNEIADILLKSLCERSFPIFLTTFAGQGFSEADVFGINRNGFMYEYEIKRSRADFFADFKNKPDKHRKLKERYSIHLYDEWKHGKQTGDTYECILIPNRFFFVCEEGLIKPEEVPEYAGLIYIDPTINFITEKKPAKLLHKTKANNRIYERVATVLSQRMFYGCSYFTFKHKVDK